MNSFTFKIPIQQDQDASTNSIMYIYDPYITTYFYCCCINVRTIVLVAVKIQ